MDEGDATLRHQFQVLQEQQQKKLMRMKQRQEGKTAKKDGSGSKSEEVQGGDSQMNGFGVQDDLGLKVCVKLKVFFIF